MEKDLIKLDGIECLQLYMEKALRPPIFVPFLVFLGIYFGIKKWKKYKKED
jgi:hypothetical protein